ncbi:MAG: UvrD-helicase domain-containing protein [Desulfobacterales bacterium]|nr:UvrD-helicase domain-containing protein [Desulfobacterales bacterium]
MRFYQYRLIRALAPADKDICVIGDPNQAIYGFRDSDTRYFYAFQKDYPSVRSICLTQNYRSTVKGSVKGSSLLLTFGAIYNKENRCLDH